MAHKIPRSENILLASDRAGDEGKVRAILADWGMEKAAIERMLAEQRARERRRADRSNVRVRQTPCPVINNAEKRGPGLLLSSRAS